MNKIINGIILTAFGIGTNTLHSTACKPVLCVQDFHTLCRPFEASVITGLGSVILIAGILFVCFGIYELLTIKKEATK